MSRFDRGAEHGRDARPAAILLVLLAAACGGDSEPDRAEAAPTPVRTMSVSVTTSANPVRTSGVIASRAEMDLAFKIPGYVADVMVDEGDRVSADQVLARLRTDEVDAQVRAAEAQAEYASRTFERLERLYADSVVTEAALDEARDARERAEAALDVARFNQAYATIRAPAAGRVLQRMIEVSEFVGAGAPAFRLGSTTSGWVLRVSVADRHVVRLSLGDSATVGLPQLDDGWLSGRVTMIADAADARTGTFDVEVTIDEAPRTLRSGMVARVTLHPSDAVELSLVPPQALVDTRGVDAAVFVVRGDRVSRLPVHVVRIGSEFVGIRAPGLEGETIVTDGAAYLSDGDRVEDRTVDFPPAAG